MTTPSTAAARASVVPIFDVVRQYHALKPAIDRVMAEVCASGSFIDRKSVV